jgi:hypothetical protein
MIEIFKNKLLKEEHFVFTKFGDGEIICMLGLYKDGDTNCDYQTYSKHLAEKLWDAAKYYSKNEKIYIGEWNDLFGQSFKDEISRKGLRFQYAPYDSVLHIEKDNISEVVEFYKTLKSKEKKIYVCPEILQSAKSFLNCEVVHVKENDAFSEYENIKNKLLSTDSTIFLYSCGMMSKVLIHDVLKNNPNTTHIDIGSGLDNLFYGITRSYQIAKEDVIKYYV